MEKFSQGWGRARNSRSVLQLLLELADAMIIVSASVSQIVGALAAGICLHHCAQCRTQPHVWRGSFMKTCVSVMVRAAAVLRWRGRRLGGVGMEDVTAVMVEIVVVTAQGSLGRQVGHGSQLSIFARSDHGKALKDYNLREGEPD